MCKKIKKGVFKLYRNFFVDFFNLIERGELSNFIWNAIPNSKTGVVKVFFCLF